MSEELDLEIDMGGMTAEDLQRGGKCTQPGWYRCVLEDVTRKKEESLNLQFRIADGVYKGDLIYQTLYVPGYANDPDKETNAIRKMDAWAQRLGIDGGESPGGKKKYLWSQAIGKQVVVEQTSRRYQDERSGEWVTRIEPAYVGVYPPDHPKIPDDVRKKLGLPPARAEAPKESRGQQHLKLGEGTDHGVVANAHARRQAATKPDLSDL